MTEFIWPSNQELTENEQLSNACDHIRELMEKNERILAVSRRRGKEHSEMEASMLMAQSLLMRAATTTVGYKGIIPLLAYQYDPELKEDLETYKRKSTSSALSAWVISYQVETLEEVSSQLNGSAKRLVDNKIRQLKLAADKGQNHD